MANYICKTTFGSFRFSADFAQAASNIWSLPDRGDDGEGFATPYQVADARHSPERAARLLIEYFGRDYWCDESVVDEDDDGEETFDGKSKEDYLDGLIVSVDEEEEPTATSIEVSGLGGTMWHVWINLSDGSKIACRGMLDYGEIDGHGQWEGDDDELKERAVEYARENAVQQVEIGDDIAVQL